MGDYCSGVCGGGGSTSDAVERWNVPSVRQGERARLGLKPQMQVATPAARSPLKPYRPDAVRGHGLHQDSEEIVTHSDNGRGLSTVHRGAGAFGVIDPEKAPKLSDPFDRASFITAQLNDILKAIGKIDGKLDAFEGRLYRVESDGRVTRAVGYGSVVMASLALVLAIVALVIAISA
jgi:hypothetical protein